MAAFLLDPAHPPLGYEELAAQMEKEASRDLKVKEFLASGATAQAVDLDRNKVGSHASGSARFLVGSGLEKFGPVLDDAGFASVGVKAFDLIDDVSLTDAVGKSPAEVKKLRERAAARTSGAAGVPNVPKQSVKLSEDATMGTSI